jgi:hypothetical protein
MTDNPFPLNSRYKADNVRQYTTADGETVPFVGRRIIPEMDRYSVLDRHRTVTSERIDQVADAFYGDPEQYWRICDANGVRRPAEADDPVGHLLVIPMPMEMTGRGDA